MTPWPLSIRPRRQAFYLQTLSVVFTNPYTNVQQVLERDGQRWVVSLEIERAGDTARELDALLASIRGPVGEVLVPDFRTLAARGSLAGAPTLTGGLGRTLTLTGCTPGAVGVLLPGDMIQTSTGRGHIVTAQVDADGAGAANVPIEPRLREAVSVGPLVTSDVRVRMRLGSDDAGRNPTRPPRRSTWSLTFLEILPEPSP